MHMYVRMYVCAMLMYVHVCMYVLVDSLCTVYISTYVGFIVNNDIIYVYTIIILYRIL